MSFTKCRVSESRQSSHDFRLRLAVALACAKHVSDLSFIECIAALGKFFFAISGLSDRHGVDLTATSVKPL
jgi:hypothetical protein